MSSWEGYWNEIRESGMDSQVFWDSVPERAAQEDLQRFINYFDPDLPLMDLGCGNGRQSRFLAAYFLKVIGVDIAPSAIQLAINATPAGSNIEYRVCDAVDEAAARALHEEFGDMNIYMRGVLHMIKRRYRAIFIENLGTILGNRGTLYQIELPSEAILYLRKLPETLFASIPKITRRIGFNLEERQVYYPDEKWIVLSQGQPVFIHTVPLFDGNEGAVPANYLIARRRN
jgi:SAM-dependent methyltransferase